MSRLLHIRYLRYRTFERVTRHTTRFLSFLRDQAERLSGTGTGAEVTFDNATDRVLLTAHGYESGDGPFLLSNSGGALPAELDSETPYWINAVSTDAFTLHTNEADAIAGTNPVTFTDDGTGTSSVYVAAEERDIFNALKAGATSQQVAGLESIDDL